MAMSEPEGDEAGDVPQKQQLRGERSLIDLCRSYEVDEIVVPMDDRRRQFPMEQPLEGRLDGVDIVDLVTFLERETGKVRSGCSQP